MVGAPYEGEGAIYVYQGGPRGLKAQYSQRITPEALTTGYTTRPLEGFGGALSRGVDVDGNRYQGESESA